MIQVSLSAMSCASMVQADDGPIVLFLLWTGVFAVIVFTGAVAGGAVAATLLIGTILIVSAIMLILLALFITGTLHLLLAIIIGTRRPPTFVIMRARWWSVLTLGIGVFAAIPFFWLHYRPGIVPRCYGCGYDRRGLAALAGCPECGRGSRKQRMFAQRTA